MSIARVFQKGYRRVLWTVAAVALLGVLMTPKADALTATPNLEHNVSRNSGWAKQTVIAPGQSVNLLLSYHNLSSNHHRAMLKDALPSKITMVPGSAYLYTPAHPNGVKQADTLTTTGINSGLLNPGDTAYIQLTASTSTTANFACGDTVLVSHATATVIRTGASYASNARITVHRDCTATAVQHPRYSCDAVSFKVEANRSVTAASFKYTATGGATFKSTDVNWGDGTGVRTVRTDADGSHVYAKDGTYVVTVVAHFMVNGKDVTDNCTSTVRISTPNTPASTPVTPASTPTTPANQAQNVADEHDNETPAKQPTTLVNTGAGSVWGIALAAVFVGTTLRYTLLRRRVTRA